MFLPVDIMSFWIPLVFTFVIIAFAATVILQIWFRRISLHGLLEEPGTNKASLSRFQFLLFSFVIAILYYSLCMRAGDLIDIPDGVFYILGISGGSFLVSKQISTTAQNKATGQESENASATNPAVNHAADQRIDNL